jgi:cysteine synthase
VRNWFPKIAFTNAQLVKLPRGYDYIVITNEKTSKEKVDAMKAYGGEVIVSPSGVSPDHPDHYQMIENRLCAENPGTYYGEAVQAEVS